ncbi:MAG: hypothetical protein CMJ48_08265 [Planctomycetaceae bacterium]|nr:hypothetical protein [Planctomycetaceae bacterium]
MKSTPMAAMTLCVVYCISYIVLLDPEQFTLSYLCVGDPCPTVCARVPEYRLDHPLIEKTFAPLLWVDVRVRPDYWQWQEHKLPVSADLEEDELETARRRATESGNPEAETLEAASKTQIHKQSALRLLDEARIALREGDLDSAGQKALAAQEIDVRYGLFEDRPEYVLADIERLNEGSADGQR